MGETGAVNLFKPSSILLTFQGDASFEDPFCYLWLMFVFYAVESVPWSIVVTCLERTDILALLFAVFSCVCFTYPFIVPTWVYQFLIFAFLFTLRIPKVFNFVNT